jgi:pantetheine-phosphate adenylyltransferase
VAKNSAKKPLFTADERVELIRRAVGDDPCVEVKQFQGLLVDFAREVGASLIIRGLRAVSDFEYEFQMALMNRNLSPKLETVFMVPSVETTYISSSIIREVAQYGGALDGLVHPAVLEALHAKFAAGNAR